MKGLVPVFLAALLILSASAGAIEVHESQEDITLIMEQGSTLEFPLVLLYIKATDQNLFAYDEIEDWVMFGEAKLKEYDFNKEGFLDAVKVTIDIPADAEVGEYEGGIASNSLLSEITIKVVPPLGDIQGMQDLEAMKGELQAMTESIRSELNSTKGELQEKIADISQYQQNLTKLETELAELREKSAELKETNTQLTGQAVGTGSTQLIIGIFVGVIIVILFLYRARIGKTFKRVKRQPKAGAESYRGWKHS